MLHTRYVSGRVRQGHGGIMIDGHIFRFASCPFGQKTAGSSLGAIVRSVARYFARLQSPVHVAASVDDLIFIILTPEHGACEGFAGGCRVCAKYHGRALEVQHFCQFSGRRRRQGCVSRCQRRDTRFLRRVRLLAWL